MRLTMIKLAGFKSFVDPTQITFPSNLTGVVGPNGCGKSNVIDAVRWVMGELSAKHLRGDNMADVVFNGSAARKPVGMASVELVFDNSDGKIGGAYASYGEISLKRQVARDDTSAYFINGVRCRRKDITNLFLGTGLGSRSYAIIEQGTISRVIEAKSEDMRAFVEEAAGVSRYKERRKETEARIAETRENLERLQDVRDEVEKQIRHLQRQAATARRYQALKEQERRLAAELLALRLRDLDSGGKVHDAAVRGRELAMQEALAAQRAAEAAIEKQRAVQTAHGERLSAVQGRYYQVGADISRLEQSIEHTRELRERQRADLAQAQATLGELAAHIARDEGELAAVRAEIARLAPEREAAQQAEQRTGAALEASEQALQEWQQRWEEHTRAASGAQQSTEVERTRIEQLENQLRQLRAQAERLAGERLSLGAQEGGPQLGQLALEESEARRASERCAGALAEAQAGVQARRGVDGRIARQGARGARRPRRRTLLHHGRGRVGRPRLAARQPRPRPAGRDSRARAPPEEPARCVGGSRPAGRGGRSRARRGARAASAGRDRARAYPDGAAGRTAEARRAPRPAQGDPGARRGSERARRAAAAERRRHRARERGRRGGPVTRRRRARARAGAGRRARGARAHAERGARGAARGAGLGACALTGGADEGSRPARERGVAPFERELDGRGPASHERAARAARATARGARAGAGHGR